MKKLLKSFKYAFDGIYTGIKEEQNIKIYPIYKMLSWDLLFYYSINFY